MVVSPPPSPEEPDDPVAARVSPPAEPVVQALTMVDPRRTDSCIILGTFGVEAGADVVYPDRAQARAVGADARNDARLQAGCRDGSG